MGSRGQSRPREKARGNSRYGVSLAASGMAAVFRAGRPTCAPPEPSGCSWPGVRRLFPGQLGGGIRGLALTLGSEDLGVWREGMEGLHVAPGKLGAKTHAVPVGPPPWR